MDERKDPGIGEVQWHSSEEDGGPDVGILIGLSDGKTLWCGEVADKHGIGPMGFAIYQGMEAHHPPFDYDGVRDVLEHHIAPFIRKLARTTALSNLIAGDAHLNDGEPQ